MDDASRYGGDSGIACSQFSNIAFGDFTSCAPDACWDTCGTTAAAGEYGKKVLEPHGKQLGFPNGAASRDCRSWRAERGSDRTRAQKVRSAILITPRVWEDTDI